ncbi:TOBE domain-containing protein [Peribacillus butanolivorans]|uniref:TOBE domain-containing protein n=1 Tax=Peribacillus butanolivorans TaxID=421767 RepID=UPI002852CCC6|nr:TOBE domain-containing protein [Peribacillus butanolivorans]
MRPEILQLVSTGEDSLDLQENWGIKGFIKDISMTGNVLRYEVETDESAFLVDYLHHRGRNNWIQA